jgi:hypothetical protein
MCPLHVLLLQANYSEDPSDAEDSGDSEDSASDCESDSEDSEFPVDSNRFRFTPRKPGLSGLRAAVAAAAAAEGMILPPSLRGKRRG